MIGPRGKSAVWEFQITGMVYLEQSEGILYTVVVVRMCGLRST
jgi:hypothetical protein